MLGLALAVSATACTAESAGASDLGDRGDGPVAAIQPSTTRCTTDDVAASLEAGPPASRPTQLPGLTAREAIRLTTVFGYASVAVEATGVGTDLASMPDLTILMPTDCAVAASRDTFDAWLADPDGALRTAMSYHVIPAGRLGLQALAELGQVPTLSGELLTVTVDEAGLLRLDGVGTVVLADLQTSNATIHVVDALLVPPSLRPEPDA